MSARLRPFALVSMLLVAGCGAAEVQGKPGTGATGGSGGAGPGPASDGASFAVPDAATGDAPPQAPRPPTSGEQCLEEAVTGEQLPLDLMLVLDASGSMNLMVGGQTRWRQVTGALDSFVRDPRSSGLGVGLQVFPYSIAAKPCTDDGDCGGTRGRRGFACAPPSVCVGGGVALATARTCDPNDAYCPEPGTGCEPVGRCAGSGARCLNLGQTCPGGGGMCGDAPTVCKLPIDSCELADYTRPRIPLAALPGAAPAVSQGMQAIKPGGNTPIAPAVAGAASYLRAHLAQTPGRRAALVLASDASPNVCAGADVAGVVAAIEAARAGTPPLPTYVIGAVSPGDMIRTQASQRFAQAGGTGTPFILSDTAADLGDRFLAALSAIRGNALPCEFRIGTPTAGTIDYGKVNVRFVTPGAPTDLVYVASADRCDPTRGGWYYDVDPARGTPTTVMICPATCARFKAEAGGAVELRFGCRTRID
jgi:Mg-chelatase subunit ChlD